LPESPLFRPALAAGLQGLQAHDSFGYTLSANVPFSYLDISSTGSTVLSMDDGTALIQLGLRFVFTAKITRRCA
jgi:hypothetical protein